LTADGVAYMPTG